MNHDRQGTDNIRRGHADSRGTGSSGDGIGSRLINPSLPLRAQIAPGGVRPTVAELRAAAEMARRREPKAARRAILDLGLATGQPFSDVATLTIGDMEYVVKRLAERSRGSR